MAQNFDGENINGFDEFPLLFRFKIPFKWLYTNKKTERFS